MTTSMNTENANTVATKNTNNMKKQLNLLFIEGNRQKIDKANIKEAYQKISTHGYISTMPMEYLPMEKALAKLGGQNTFQSYVSPQERSRRSNYFQLRHQNDCSHRR